MGIKPASLAPAAVAISAFMAACGGDGATLGPAEQPGSNPTAEAISAATPSPTVTSDGDGSSRDDGEPIVAAATVMVSTEDATSDDIGPDNPPDDIHEDGDHQAATDDRAIEITYQQGAAIVADDRIDIRRGEEVTLVIESDVAEHVHIHGYDLFVDVDPSGPATITFTAEIPGVFEIEFEDSLTFITELVVS